MSYVVMLSVYASAFGSYGSTFFPETTQVMWSHILLSAAVIGFTVINIISTKLVAKSELYIVVIKLTILIGFIVIGFWSINYTSLTPDTWSHHLHC
jgi:hypothetical protein